MRLSRLFAIALALMLAGIAASLVALFYGAHAMSSTSLFDKADAAAAAGQVSSAIAAIFGLGVGSFALFAFIASEDSRNKVADNVWRSKQRLEESLHQYAAAASFQEKTQRRGRVTAVAVQNLWQALVTANESGLYTALHAINSADAAAGINRQIDAARAMLIMQARLQSAVEQNAEAPPDVTRLLPPLFETLTAITLSNVRRHLDEPLPRDVINQLRQRGERVTVDREANAARTRLKDSTQKFGESDTAWENRSLSGEEEKWLGLP